jgi:ABC-type transport system involved in cytochrome c biogenesis permease subunit
MKNFNRKTIAWLSIAGFIAVMFTYFGVNFVLAGLHSYA